MTSDIVMDAIFDALRSKCKLSEESEQYLSSSLVNSKIDELSKEDYEALHDELNAGCGDFLFDGSVREFKVPARDVADGIPIDVIKPHLLPRQPGIVVFFHGGGNVFGSRKTHDLICKQMASNLQCIVVNVEYRLAPEHKFPAMFDDGKSVTRWVLMNKPLIGADNDSRVGVSGSSAGGGIAATVAFEIPTLDFQILIYPLVDWRCDGDSYAKEDAQAMEILDRMLAKSCESPSDRSSVRASPLLQPNFSRLPPTLILAAEADILKDSNYAYKAKLKAANVPCESRLMKGTVHGFFSLPGLFKTPHEQAKETMLKFFKKNGTH